MKKQLRREISTIDRELAHLLNQRLHLVKKLLAWKIEHGEPLVDRQREAETLTFVQRESSDEMRLAVTQIFESILTVGKRQLTPSTEENRD